MKFFKVANSNFWTVDVIICSLFLLIGPHFFADIIGRNLLGFPRFQSNWFFIVIANIRLAIIFFSRNSKSRKFLILALKLFTPVFFVIFYTAVLTFFQPHFLVEKGIYFDSITISFIVVRGIKYIAYIGLALYFASVINRWEKLYAVLMFLVFGLCIAEILGLIQEAIFIVSGVDLFPIIRASPTGSVYQSATINLMGIRFLRINSLSHEPKGLAALLCVLFIFKIYFKTLLAHAKQYIYVNSFFKKYVQRTWPITIFALGLTFSGSGLVVFSSILFMVSISSLPRLCRSGKMRSQLVISFLIFLVSLLTLLQFPAYVSSFFDASILRRTSGFFEERTVNSLYASSTDPEDAAAIINILQHPTLAAIGIGFGGYSNISLPIVATMYRKTVDQVSPFSRNILIEIIFSSGIIGVVGCLVFARKIFNNLRLIPSINMILGLVIISSFLIRSIEMLFFVFIGLSCFQNDFSPLAFYDQRNVEE